ncbi:MAG: leucine-rich repeat domain-containing protein [Negativicoccus succinicivorans]|uniref:leucine-rich repeat domain-containing protein n=1 Tax=Negativicoccus succinicivorans TaxID=620903 RepID=UPI00290EDCED|nr:leucine-rich repeat domain-containing protein [Negativicoccus succinicivorans]MDU5395757.1 leucine-rich repeat domain-containing protein [Negativicoccus succinicivorans]
MRILLGRVKGDKGDTGSQGPRGPRGERGPQGPPGEPGQTDIYTRAESDARYQLKGGASVESFYQWLKERNYDMDNFRGLETIFPVVTLQSIKVDTIEEDATEMTGTASPNVKIIFNGKTAISDSDGRWRLPAVPDPSATEIAIQWVDYAGRTHTEKTPVFFKKYCIPNGIQIVTQSIAEKYELNKPENLEFPASVTQIEERALYNYARITGAAAPNCEHVGDKAFCGCSQLKTVSLPACTTLANDVFFQCSNLTEISLPECTKIGGWAFYSCIRLVTVSIPKCADIGNFSFDGCKNLRTVILSENWIPNAGLKIPTTATVYNANKTKKVNWSTESWVNV